MTNPEASHMNPPAPEKQSSTCSGESGSHRRPVLFVRQGRGRTGGSTGLDWAVQRARHQGRRVRVLDGDLRSRTLSNLHPAGALDERTGEGTSSPRSENPAEVKAWLNAELDILAERGDVSAVLDLGGGERVIADYVLDLELNGFCEAYGIRLVAAFYVGADPEDLRHVLELVRSGDLAGAHLLITLNEGMVRQGMSTEEAFAPVIGDRDFVGLVDGGARAVFMRRLGCIERIRSLGYGYYDVLARTPGRDGCKPSPIMHHLTSTWLNELEREYARRDVLDWLP